MSKSNILLLIVGLFIAFIVAEVSLRLYGIKPGNHTNPYYFSRVDTLKELNGYTTDQHGIQKVSSEARTIIRNKIELLDRNRSNLQVGEIFCLASDNIDILTKKTTNGISKKYFDLQNGSIELTRLDSAIIEYVKCPINKEGFRSIEFRQYESPSVLLLGDSFTWGHSTTNKNNSFADILLSKGYPTYNTGISAVDVGQYLAIAKKYIPILKPDFVIVNFYLGNDVSYHKRPLEAFRPIFYATNAGNLMRCPHGNCFEDMDEAYQYLNEQWSIPKERNLLNKIMSLTSTTTICWKVLLKLKIVSPSDLVVEHYEKAKRKETEKPYSNLELQEIKQIAQSNNCKFILSSIPEVYSTRTKTSNDIDYLFDEIDFVEMPVVKDNYKLSDGHFNDLGHSEYAKFLIDQIKTFE